MGFSSVSDFLNKTTTLGYKTPFFWQKMLGATGAFTAGRWYCMGMHVGSPMLARYGERLLNGQLMGDASNWTLNAANWSWVNGVLNHTTGSAATAVAHSIGGAGAGIESGPKYALEWWLSTATTAGGGITPSVGGANFTNRSTVGQWHEIVTSGSTADLTFTPVSGTFVGNIQNISLLRLLRGVPLTSADMGSLYTGPEVNSGGLTKHLLFGGIVSAAANFVPGTWMLVDMLKAYPVDMHTNLAQTLDDYEHVANGTFTGSAASWTVGSPSWSYGTNNVVKDADGVLTLSQTTTPAAVAGKVYAVRYTISAMSVGGTLTVGFGGATTTRTLAEGTFTEFITATAAGALIFTPPNLSRFTIDTVSVTLALPRYSDGAGVRPFVVWNTGAWQAASNGTSVVAHNYAEFTYTNDQGTTGKTLPMTVAGVTGAVSVLSHIDHSGVAANNIGPFLPLATGDAGVRSVQTLRLSAAAGANNVATVCLCRPLAVIPNTTASVATERDFLNQIGSLPEIKDGAVLTWLFMPGAATAVSTSAYGWGDIVWG
jgi:hypothetical protein